MTRTKFDPSFVKLALVLLTGVLAVVFDTTIVNVALDTLGRDLHVPVTTIQWVTTGYLLALGVAVPVTGWLTDRFGGKRIWLAALALFLIGSVGAALAGDATALIAARVAQGLGGGLMLPVMTTLLVQASGGRLLGSATAFITLPAMLGPIFGPFGGGLIVQHLSWRWIFLINVPFCVAGLLLAWFLMPAFPGTGRIRLDGLGLALVSPGIAAVVFGLARVGASGGFGHLSVLLPLVLGALLLIVFTVRARARGSAALVDVRLFRLPSFSAATGLLFLSGFALYGALFLVPLYLQQVRGFSPLSAGLFLAAQGVGLLASRTLAGNLTDRIGTRWVAFAGLAVTAAATIPFALAGSSTNIAWLTVVLVLRGMGLGAVTIPVMAAAYYGLTKTEIPHASILTRTAQQIGGSFGTAVLAVVLEHYAGSHALTSAFDIAFWWSIACAAAALLLALLLPARPEPTPVPAPVPAPAEAPAA